MRNEETRVKELQDKLDILEAESDKMIVDILSRANIWANGCGQVY